MDLTQYLTQIDPVFLNKIKTNKGEVIFIPDELKHQFSFKRKRSN